MTRPWPFPVLRSYSYAATSYLTVSVYIYLPRTGEGKFLIRISPSPRARCRPLFLLLLLLLPPFRPRPGAVRSPTAFSSVHAESVPLPFPDSCTRPAPRPPSYLFLWPSYSRHCSVCPSIAGANQVTRGWPGKWSGLLPSAAGGFGRHAHVAHAATQERDRRLAVLVPRPWPASFQFVPGRSDLAPSATILSPWRLNTTTTDELETSEARG